MRHLSKASLVARIFEAVPYATFLVDPEIHVLHMNGEAERLRGTAGEQGEATLHRIGELLWCGNSKMEPDGCGFSRECHACVIRDSVRRALQGDVVRRNLQFMKRERDGERSEICLQVSASPIEHERHRLAVLVLDDVTDIVYLRGLMPICSGCDSSDE